MRILPKGIQQEIRKSHLLFIKKNQRRKCMQATKHLAETGAYPHTTASSPTFPHRPLRLLPMKPHRAGDGGGGDLRAGPTGAVAWRQAAVCGGMASTSGCSTSLLPPSSTPARPCRCLTMVSEAGVLPVTALAGSMDLGGGPSGMATMCSRQSSS
jgi:hypothetical protein